MEAARCLCCCAPEKREILSDAARMLYPEADCTFSSSAGELRSLLIQEGDRSCAAIVGFCGPGVSDINLCAAVVLDGCAREVVLVVDNASGSLRSRAMSAGITRVVESGAPKPHPVREATQQSAQPGMPPTEQARDGAGASAPLVVLCSGRGGVGKTSVVACAAAAAASWGMRVEAVDLDLSCGNLYAALGLARGTDLSRLSTGDLENPERLARLGAPCGERIRVWGPCERPETSELAAAVVPGLLEALARATDLVLVDTSPTFSDAVALAVRESDRVVLVHDRRPGSLASLSRTSGLAVRLGVARTRIARLENRVNVRDRTDQAFGRAEVGLEAARAFSVLEGGDEVADYLGYGDAAGLLEVGSPFAESVAACLAQLLQELGVLPEAEAAQHAAEGLAPRRRGLFGRRREAV